MKRIAPERTSHDGRSSRGEPRGGQAGTDVYAAVSALYEVHAVRLVRLAVVLLNDRQAAEDVVQDAFCGLYRRWPHLSDPENALSYLRSAVLNRCRSEFRARARASRRQPPEGVVASAEQQALLAERQRELLAALRRLPARQREALLLRFYLSLSEAETAACMRVSQGTVKSTTSRGLAALARLLKEET